MKRIRGMEELRVVGEEIKKSFPGVNVVIYGDLVLASRGEQILNDPPVADIAVVYYEDRISRGLERELEIRQKLEKLGYTTQGSEAAGMVNPNADINVVWVDGRNLAGNRTALARIVNDTRVDL